MTRTEDQVAFYQVRDGSPQWEVWVDGWYVARVTERYVSTPPYVINFDRDDDTTDVYHDNRVDVVDEILRYVNAPASG